MAASLRNFTLSDSEHCELRVFTATCTGSAEPLDHKPRLTTPNSPDPSCCEILQWNYTKELPQQLNGCKFTHNDHMVTANAR